CALVCSSAESSDNNNANFLTWLQANGATHPPISVKDFDDYGKGLLAVQSIKHGDMIMDIPAKVILSRETITASSKQHMAYITHELLSKLQNDEDVLAVVLAREKLKGMVSCTMFVLVVCLGLMAHLSCDT